MTFQDRIQTLITSIEDDQRFITHFGREFLFMSESERNAAKECYETAIMRLCEMPHELKRLAHLWRMRQAPARYRHRRKYISRK